MLRKLRHDGAATKDNHVFARLTLHRLDLARFEFMEQTGISPRKATQGLGEYYLSHVVQGYCDSAVFRRSSPRMVRVRNRAGVVYNNVPPERLEDFVRPTPEENCIE